MSILMYRKRHHSNTPDDEFGAEQAAIAQRDARREARAKQDRLVLARRLLMRSVLESYGSEEIEQVAEAIRTGKTAGGKAKVEELVQLLTAEQTFEDHWLVTEVGIPAELLGVELLGEFEELVNMAREYGMPVLVNPNITTGTELAQDIWDQVANHTRMLALAQVKLDNVEAELAAEQRKAEVEKAEIAQLEAELENLVALNRYWENEFSDAMTAKEQTVTHIAVVVEPEPVSEPEPEPEPVVKSVCTVVNTKKEAEDWAKRNAGKYVGASQPKKRKVTRKRKNKRKGDAFFSEILDDLRRRSR